MEIPRVGEPGPRAAAAMACQSVVTHGHSDRSGPVARARELGAEIVAAADEIEYTRRVPEVLLERLHGVERRFPGGETEPSRVESALLVVSALSTVIARRTVTCCQTTNAGSC